MSVRGMPQAGMQPVWQQAAPRPVQGPPSTRVMLAPAATVSQRWPQHQVVAPRQAASMQLPVAQALGSQPLLRSMPSMPCVAAVATAPQLPLGVGNAVASAPSSSPPSPVRAAPVLDFLEEGHKVEAWLSEESQRTRRAALNLEGPGVSAFIEENEFVSLGAFCGVARALQAIGIKKVAYPFDWVRCPADGVIHCFDNRFEDFLTYTQSSHKQGVGQVFSVTRWGGSFWHHDPEKPGTADDFTRRAERLLGLLEVPASKARVFVRAVNSTCELEDVPRLYEALQRAFPQASRVRLLVLVDLQKCQGPRRLAESCAHSRDLLFYFLHEDLFAGLDGQPLPPGKATWSMQRHAEAYAEAVAYACGYWSGTGPAPVETAADVRALSASCQQMDAGSPACDMFLPRRIKGPRLSVRQLPAPEEQESEPLTPKAVDQAIVHLAEPGTLVQEQKGGTEFAASGEWRVALLQNEIRLLRELLIKPGKADKEALAERSTQPSEASTPEMSHSRPSTPDSASKTPDAKSPVAPRDALSKHWTLKLSTSELVRC